MYREMTNDGMLARNVRLGRRALCVPLGSADPPRRPEALAGHRGDIVDGAVSLSRDETAIGTQVNLTAQPLCLTLCVSADDLPVVKVLNDRCTLEADIGTVLPRSTTAGR